MSDNASKERRSKRFWLTLCVFGAVGGSVAVFTAVRSSVDGGLGWLLALVAAAGVLAAGWFNYRHLRSLPAALPVDRR